MGGCSSKKSLKLVHPALEVVPSEPTPVAAPPAVASSATPGQDAAHAAPVPKAKAKAKAKPTSLIKAIKVNDLNVVEEMLQAPDCNLELLGMWDNTPLLAACMYGHSEVALKLMARGANVFATNEHGATALHYSSVEGCLDVTKVILEQTDAEKLAKLGTGKVKLIQSYRRQAVFLTAATSVFYTNGWVVDLSLVMNMS
eukprot:Skav231992  [mRNA]  locus=scaffold719:366654:367250:- [translate_table: standard]